MTPEIGRNILVVAALIFLAILGLKKNQDVRLNWAIFYSVLYTSVSLAIINPLCVYFKLWHYNGIENLINMPWDIYFLWVIIWGIIPVLFLSKRSFLIIVLAMIWIDLLLMPKLAEFNIHVLGSNWLIGEGIMLSLVFAPGYLWAYASYHSKWIGLRALFQIITMSLVFVMGLPYILNAYNLIEEINLYWSGLIFQLFLIITFPSLIAVFDLVTKGRGTPFPYDQTKKIVRTGVYGYCRNPIQWSFTLLFIPLSIYYSSFYLLIGSVVSFAYSFGVSDFQEYPDMEKRFGNNWTHYKGKVPKWYFLWKPKYYPKGTIYFDPFCTPCSQIKQWFIKSKAINLEVIDSTKYPGKGILQVTYVDHEGRTYHSVNAIASAFEHINLAMATLGWFMRMPGINHLLQAIIDTMEFSPTNGTNEDSCELP